MLDLFRPISITYGITVCNEYHELKILLDKLLPLIDKDDEVIILQDITNENQLVTELVLSYGPKIKKIEAKLNDDFASFKNNLIVHAKGRYLFQIDADEYPEEDLIKNLKAYLRKERKADCFLVPRINIVEGITDEYIQKMKWNINEKRYINFPDYQPRLIKNNKKYSGRIKSMKFFTVIRDWPKCQKMMEIV